MTARYARSYVHFDTLSELGHLITPSRHNQKEGRDSCEDKNFSWGAAQGQSVTLESCQRGKIL